MATTLRKSDSASEREVAKFLDKYFYPKHVTNFIRHDDIDHQFSGIDVQFDYNGSTGLLVDEKALSHYVNRNIPTSAFEVDFNNTAGELTSGWLYDSKKSTQYYLIAWLWASKEKEFTAEDISQIELIIISRQNIIEMLKKYDITHQAAFEISKEIRSKGEYGASHKETGKPFYFFNSTQLSEKPINIIIHKSKLIEIALGHHIVKP